jgi:hypothetical protein
MHVKSQPQNKSLVVLVLVELSFGRVVFWSSFLLVELILIDLLWLICRLVELSIDFEKERTGQCEDFFYL